MGMGNYDFEAQTPVITPGSTSYFSAPSTELDPTLFNGTAIKGWVREGILTILFHYLGQNFNEPHKWTRAWLAGSGVSYQWAAQREPGDLDCLVGIEYVRFRQLNDEYVGYSNNEIAAMFNERFNADIMPSTRNWEGYELTFYVNPATDITEINPYAAYDLIADLWTVKPDLNPQPPYSRDWEQKAMRDRDAAQEVLTRYSNALKELRSATNPAYRINAERKLKLAQEQAVAIYEEIHKGRKEAFSQTGSGYSDYHNYRWQAGKKSGAIQALRSIKDIKDEMDLQTQKELYGVELPDASTLIRRTLRG
jgi:hypothetical protein